MYCIDKDGSRSTITGQSNKEVIVHSIDGFTIKVSITLNDGQLINGKMNLIDFINMMESV